MRNQRISSAKRCFVLIAALLLACFAACVPDQSNQVFARTAHAVLVHSEPVEGSVLTRPPSAIQLWFSESVQLVTQSIRVFDPAGKSVQQGTIQEFNGVVSTSLRVQTDGTYLVTWQAVSQDTDPISGSFTFSLRHIGGIWSGTASSSGVSPAGFGLQLLAHLLHFLGYALSFGSLLFFSLVVSSLERPLQQELQPPIWRLVNLGILLLLLAEGMALLAQCTSPNEIVDPIFLGTILGSSFGRELALRLGVALSLWVIMGILTQGHRKALPIALVLGVALAAIDSAASHAISSSLLWLAVLATTLHIAAMGAWVGGGMALIVLWRYTALKARRRELLARFSFLAAVSVVELVITGLVLAGLHLTSPADLLITFYGRILTIKVVALLLPLLFVALSLRAPLSSRGNWWRLELLTLLGILTLAATLVSLPAPR